jgi:transglutaminase-like putative cysteine protease
MLDFLKPPENRHKQYITYEDPGITTIADPQESKKAVPKILELAAKIRLANGGDRCSRLKAIAAAVNELIPYDPAADRGYKIFKADRANNATGILRAGRGVCRHRAPLLVEALRRSGLPDTFQVWFDLFDPHGNHIVSHTNAFIASRKVFVEPGSIDDPNTVQDYTQLRLIHGRDNLTPGNFRYRDPRTNQWIPWF